jgi:hypothetical protein
MMTQKSVFLTPTNGNDPSPITHMHHSIHISRSTIIRSAISSSFFNKIKKCRVSDQDRWIQLYPTTTTRSPTDSEKQIVMLLSMVAASTAWLSGREQTQNEPLSSPDVTAAESQSQSRAPSPPLEWINADRGVLGRRCIRPMSDEPHNHALSRRLLPDRLSNGTSLY